jgi:putative endonuclease
MKSGGYVYIMTNKRNGTLYIGSSSDILGRIAEHKNKIIPDSFTAKHNLDKLVYYEFHPKLTDMVIRERRLKFWHRHWKNKLIESMNPEWNDLYDDLLHNNGYSAYDTV